MRSALVLVVLAAACGAETAELVGEPSKDGSALPDASVPDGAACVVTQCADKLFACGNCADDDGDGFVDADDPDCLGACDDSESAFHPNLPGAPGSACLLDCFWDVGRGVGDDDCIWDHRCDPLEPEGASCGYDPGTKLPAGQTCEDSQSDACRDRCLASTPNGCDCFGCCVVPGAAKPVWMGSPECVTGTLADPTKCPPCTLVTSCENPCDACEICVGKPKPSTGCTSDQCPPGALACGLPGSAPCPAGTYCVTGCCTAVPT